MNVHAGDMETCRGQISGFSALGVISVKGNAGICRGKQEGFQRGTQLRDNVMITWLISAALLMFTSDSASRGRVHGCERVRKLEL